VQTGPQCNIDNVSEIRTRLEAADGTDTQTEHERGLYGNTTLWNQSSFNQGTAQDIFVISKTLNMTFSGTTNKTISLIFYLGD